MTGWPEGRAVAVYDDGLLFFQAIQVLVANTESMEEVVSAFAIGVPRADAGHHQIATLVGSKEQFFAACFIVAVHKLSRG